MMTLLEESFRAGSRYLLSAVVYRRANLRLSHRIETRRSNSNKTCLYNFHRDREARMEPFAGYLMPIVYKGQSIRSEHIQTRESASAFDVSHMMQTVIRGEDRCSFLETLTVTDIQAMRLDKSALSLFPNAEGGIIDDCIISKREDHLHLVSNAGNADIVWSWLQRNLPRDKDVQLERLEERGLIALQGPKAAQVLQGLVGVDLKELEFMNTCDTDIKDIGQCQVTRCGYTGEDGFEISVNADDASKLMQSLCADTRVKPAGLGARDTLRLEAGLCLHGHDISEKTTPIEAALNWTIQKRRRIDGGFPGYSMIIKQLKEGSKTKRAGLLACGSGPPAREGHGVVDSMNDEAIGFVTSGTHSPSLGRNIAMAYLNSNSASKLGHSVFCEVRGKKYEYEITKMPFVPAKYYVKAKV